MQEKDSVLMSPLLIGAENTYSEEKNIVKIGQSYYRFIFILKRGC